MSDAMNSHATAIKQAARDLAQGNIWGTDTYIETIDHHADALAADLDAANARVNALSEARARRFAEAVEVESERERRTMDSTTDHAARISARIEEYKTLDLIGRNSADDLQHHLRALVAERDEARARAEKLRIERDALRDAGLVDMRRYARAVELKWWNEVNDRANGHPDTENLVEDLRAAYGVAGLMDADLDDAPGDPAGER